MLFKKGKTRHAASIVALFTASVTVSLNAGEGPVGLSGIAEREIARRMARMEDARQAIEKGDAAFAAGDYEAALGYYRAALESLPDAPLTAEWRAIANAKFADASVELARDRAKNGRYKEAHELLDGALAAVPGHKGATVLKKQLGDPDRYEPALTPDHVANVENVTRALQLGTSARNLGNFDEANKHFEDALRIDPNNIAARRGMEKTEQERAKYFSSAYDHTRSKMLNEVGKAWETSVPVAAAAMVSNTGPVTTNGSAYLSQKMKTIIIPSLQLSGSTVEEAIEFLRIKSRELDDAETDPSKKGVNIIVKPGEAPVAASISLDLKDVPLEEALRYVVELAGMKVKVEPYAVMVVPTTENITEQYTRIYRVPPDFLSIGGSADSGPAAGAAPADPFAPAGGAAPASGLTARKNAKQILMDQGIIFPEGSSAVFSAATSQLIVKNTSPNLDLVEAFVDSLKDRAPKQIFITAKFVEVTQRNTDELGFDWLLGGFNVPGSERVFGSGGNVGNSPNGSLQNSSGGTVDFPFLFPGSGAPVGQNPLTRGNRSGNAAITPDSIDGLIAGNTGVSSVAPGALAFSGVLTDPQFQVVMRALNQRKGVDLMSAPSVTTKPGTRATISVIREFWYPTEFDPPEIPQQFGSLGTVNAGVGGAGGSASGSFPVTPTTPTTFEMKPIGVTMEVDPVVGADNYSIDLNLAPEVNEFEGFINYGSPIQTGGVDALGNPIQIVLTENRIPQPVFSTRKVTTSVTVWDGQTVALGGLIREDVQDVEDRVPILGDLPIIGRLFQSKAEDHFKRNLTIFVTARLIDPAGQPINPKLGSPEAAKTDPAAAAGANPGLFPVAGQ
jgi:general secretion pathway protein D